MKRQLKKVNDISPKEIMNLIDRSSDLIKVGPSVEVNWINWRFFLEKFYFIPTFFKIQQYHVFSFSSPDPTSVKSNLLSDGNNLETLKFLKPILSTHNF